MKIQYSFADSELCLEAKQGRLATLTDTDRTSLIVDLYGEEQKFKHTDKPFPKQLQSLNWHANLRNKSYETGRNSNTF